MLSLFKYIQTGWHSIVELIVHGQARPSVDPVSLESLEDRVLYDASPLAGLLGQPNENPDIVQTVDAQYTNLMELLVEQEFVDFPAYAPSIDFRELNSQPNSIAFASDPATVNTAHNSIPEVISDPREFLEAGALPSAVLESAEYERSELVFVDRGVANYQQLLADLQHRTTPDTRLEVALIDSGSDGLSQISAYLGQYGHDLDAIHFITHGSDGAIKLGNTWFDQTDLNERYAELQQWQGALNAGADLLFYGCDLAGTEIGRELLLTLAAACDCDVAGSIDDTGNTRFGGDWILEFATGTIETENPFSNEGLADWYGKLAVIVVTTFNDVVNAGDGLISLREAIIQVNAGSGGDTIELAVGTYTLSRTGTGENSAATGDLDLLKDVTINGAGRLTTVIDANGIDRVFHLMSGANVTMNGLTVTGGFGAAGAGVFIDGGAAFTMNNGRIVGNNSSNSDGGGIGLINGSITLNQVSIENNSAGTGRGGGIFNGASAVLTNVTISGNTANDGGGIYQDAGPSRSMTLTNVTVSSNIATANGGGIRTHQNTQLINSTIAFNTGEQGAGIYQAGGGSVTLKNTILDSNHRADNSNRNADGTFTSQGFNIDSDGTAGLGLASDRNNIGANLDPTLRDNGGTVATHALLLGSIAIDGGTSTGAPAADARGFARDAVADIGAFELKKRLTNQTEFLVNTTTSGNQETNSEVRGSPHAIGIADDGSYVVVWSSDNGGNWNVLGQQFDSDGVKIGSEFAVNQTITNSQHYASVAVNGRGEFVVTWTSVNQDGGGNGVYARRYDATGAAIGNEFLVNTTTAGDQDSSVVAIGADGQFLIVWEGAGTGDTDGIFGQWYGANGVASGSEVRINSTTSGLQGEPSVAMAPDGRAVIVWDDPNGVQVRVYNAARTAVAVSFNVENSNSAGEASVAMAADGSFAVVWRMTILDKGIYLRRFDATGNPLGMATVVNQTILGDQTNPSISMDSFGNFVVVWEGVGSGDSTGVFARKFTANGNAVGNEFRINQTTTGAQAMASVAMLDQSNYVVVWSGEGVGDTSGVFARQFGPANNVPTGTDRLLSMDEDASHVFSLGDFGYSDSDSDPLTQIRITTLPVNGRLLYQGATVALNAILDPTVVSAGLLRFIPNSHLSGNNAASFQFSVNDGFAWSAGPNTISFNINPDVDEPAFGAGRSLESLDGASLVNTTSIGVQSQQQIAELSDGGYIVVWQGADGDLSNGNNGTKIFWQRYAGNGQAIGGQQQLNPLSVLEQINPDVVGLSDGGFVIVWGEGVSSSLDLYAQRFDQLGNLVAVDGISTGPNTFFQVAQDSTNQQFGAKLAALDDGGFVIAWTTLALGIDVDAGISARVFNSVGNASAEFRVNNTTTGVQRDVELVALDNNKFVVGWVDQSVNSFDVKFKVIDAGNPTAGVEITANQTTTFFQYDIQLTKLSNNTFLASWEATNGLDGSAKGIFGRRFDWNGNPIDAADFVINQVTLGHQDTHSIVGLGNGEFIAFWQSNNGDADGTGIRAIRYDAALNRIGNEYVINSHHYGNQSNPEAVLLSSGEVVVVWNSADGDNGTGTWSSGVYHDRFIPTVTVPEDNLIPLNLSLAVTDSDGSESLTQVLVTGAPLGSTITDGVNSITIVSSVIPVNITGWAYSLISIATVPNWNGSFDLNFALEVTDAGQTQNWSRALRVNVTSTGDLLSLANIAASTNENSTVNIGASTIAGSITNSDQNFIVAPAIVPTISYRLNPITVLPVAGPNLVWSDTNNTVGKELLFSSTAVSYNSNPGSAFPGITAALDFNGTGGGQSTSPFDLVTGSGSMEFWVRPANKTQTSTILELGDTNFGLGLYQNGSQFEFHFFDATTIGGNTNQPWVLVCEGFSATEFNQVVMVIDSNGTSAGATSQPDLFLYLNGQLISVLADVPFNWTNSSNLSIGQPNGFDYAGPTTFGNFVGSVAELNYYSTPLSTAEVRSHYDVTSFQPGQLTQIDGQAAVAGQSYLLSSGASLTYNLDGSFTYDPQGQFDSLAAGQSTNENISLSFANGVGTVSSQLSIAVSGVNDAPVLDNSGVMTLNTITENATSNAGQTIASIVASAGGNRITDVDSGAVEGVAITALTSGNGTWQYSINGGSTWSTMGSLSSASALLLRATDFVRFVPNGQNGTTRDFTFRAWDQSGSVVGSRINTATNGGTSPFSTATETAAISVTSVNDAPVLNNIGVMTLNTITEDDTNNGGQTVASIVASAGGNRITDVDSGAVEGIAITALTSGNGSWEYSIDGGSTWSAMGTVSNASALLLRETDLVRFVPNGQNATTGDLTFRAWDQSSGAAGGKVTTATNGDTSPFSTATETAAISVTSVNDAPVLDNSGVMALNTITEDDTNNGGQTVASIVASAGGNRITDVDSGAVEGIAITALTSGNGSWEYSINGGSTWSAMGAVSNASALLLRATDLVRFVPNDQNATTGDLTFRAWDQSSGAAGSKVTTATNGGTSPFSAATETAAISVTSVNDAPVLDNSGVMVLNTITEDETNNGGQTVASIVASAGGNRITDVDSGAVEGIAITALTSGNGSWEYSIDGGTAWAGMGAVSNASALLLRATDLVRFIPNGQNATTGDLTFRAWDQDSGAAGSKVTTATNGGTSPFSTATETAAIFVSGLNDDPVLNNQSISLNDNAPIGDLVLDLDAFDVDHSVFNYQIVGGNTGGAFSINANTGEIFIATGLNFDLLNNYVLNVSATDGAGGVGLADITISLVDILRSSISGTIYEDVNGDGAVQGDGGVSGVTVILYRDQGNGVVDSGDILVSTTTTNINGGYVFSGLSSGNFYVIVDSHSIAPTAGFNAGFSSGDVWAEQTFAGTGGLSWNETTTSYATLSSPGALFGGLRGTRSDDASNPSRAEHIDFVAVNGGNSVSSTDFGFSFNVVTNLLAGDGQDDDFLANRTVQGSLRQFIQNSNAIAGRNAMHFVPVVNANRTSVLGDWWNLSVSAALPEITDALTSIDGRAYATDGITLRNDNRNWLGSTSVVGVGNDGIAVSGDEYSLTGLDAPEFEITGDGTVDRGLLIKASDVGIRHLAISGFGSVSQDQGNIVIDGTAGSISGVAVEDNVIGISAEGFVGPLTRALQTRNITVLQADNGLIRHNLIGFASQSGIELRGDSGSSDGANGWTITQNEIRDNGLNALTGDGISVTLGSSGALISRNLIIGNSGIGIDTWKSAGQHQIVNNTISGNGHRNVELGGLRLFGNQSTVTGNLVANNVGPGIHVVGDNLGNGGISASIGNLISKNSIHRNSGISIDLGSASGSLIQLNQGDGVTENGVGNDVGAGNQGLDYPELTDAYLANDGLHIRGALARGVGINRVEFYLSAADIGDQWNGHRYGEGQHYLGAKTIADFLHFNALSGEFEALLLRPLTGWPNGLATGEISMIAIDQQLRGTSEFSRNLQVGLPHADPVVVVPPPVLVGPIPVSPSDANDGTKTDTDKEDKNDVQTVDTSPPVTTSFVGPDSTSTIKDVVTQQAQQNKLLADTISNDATEIQNLVNQVDVVEEAPGNYAFSEIVRPSEVLFQLATGGITDRIVAVSTLDATVLVGLFWEELDTANREFLMEQMQIGVPTIAASTASLLTVGYLAWIIRGGVILTTFMSSLPTWKALDILPMIESANLREENDESIEQIVDN